MKKIGFRLVNRHGLIGGKHFRFEIFKSPFTKGFKISIGKYEFRFYLTPQPKQQPNAKQSNNG